MNPAATMFPLGRFMEVARRDSPAQSACGLSVVPTIDSIVAAGFILRPGRPRPRAWTVAPSASLRASSVGVAGRFRLARNVEKIPGRIRVSNPVSYTHLTLPTKRIV